MKLIAVALVLIALAIALREPWSNHVGYQSDMQFFQRWATTGAELRTSGEGIGRLYARRPDCNYPPVYPMILSYLPALDSWWRGTDGWTIPVVSPSGKRRMGPHHRVNNHLASLARMLKLPAMTADLLITFIVLAWVWMRSTPLRGTIAAGLWALNPVAIYNSAYFGQVDAIHSLWMLSALLAAVERRMVLAWALVALALLTKFQSIVVVPVIIILTLQPVIDAVRGRRPEEVWRQGRSLLLSAIAAAAVAFVILAPFARAGALKQVREVYAESVSERAHARVTVIAYNLWWMTLDVPMKFTKIPSDRVPLIGPLTARHIGYGLLATIAAVACAVAVWGGGRCSALLAAPLIALAFFVVSTQMKSRYGFASLVLMLPLLACGYRYVWVILLTSAMFLLNNARVLPLPAGFFGLTRMVNGAKAWPWLGHAVAMVLIGILVYLLIELVRSAQRERAHAALHTGA